MAGELILAFLVIIFFFAIVFYRNQNIKLRKRLQDLDFSKRSLSTKYGKMTEQFIPFLKLYPYDENNFRFLGTPVDGIQFEDNKILLVEFKTGDSRLSARQKQIRELVRKGKVEFEEVRIS